MSVYINITISSYNIIHVDKILEHEAWDIHDFSIIYVISSIYEHTNNNPNSLNI